MVPPEEVSRELVREWLRKAEEDFEVAEYLVSHDQPYFGTIGFHAQQAAEKYIKAFLVHHEVEFPKTHDLDKLLDLMATVAPSLAESLRDMTVLSVYGVEIRYPADIPEMSLVDAETAVELAGRVRDAVRNALKQ